MKTIKLLKSTVSCLSRKVCINLRRKFKRLNFITKTLHSLFCVNSNVGHAVHYASARRLKASTNTSAEYLPEKEPQKSTYAYCYDSEQTGIIPVQR